MVHNVGHLEFKDGRHDHDPYYPYTNIVLQDKSYINEQCFFARIMVIVVLGQAIIFHDISQFEFQDGCHKGSFKCYVTLEGVGGCMPKRYEALRGGGGGVTSALRNVIFF